MMFLRSWAPAILSLGPAEGIIPMADFTKSATFLMIPVFAGRETPARNISRRPVSATSAKNPGTSSFISALSSAVAIIGFLWYISMTLLRA